MTDLLTQLVTLGREENGYGTVNPPLHRASTILFPTVDALEQATAGNGPHLAYGRDGSPLQNHLQEAINALTGADATYFTSSGLSAVTTALLAVLNAGDHLLMVDSVYGCTRTFCNGMLRRLGVETSYFPPDADAAMIESLWQPNTKAVFLESPGSLTFEIQDIAPIAEGAHARGGVVIADTTWATPLHMKPFRHGIDIAIQSLTKYIGGHADLIMGAISCVSSQKKCVQQSRMQIGAHVGDDDCYLALRGLRTLGVRLRRHEAAGLEMARWLEERPEVSRVLHPALPNDSFHARYERYFSGSCGLFSVVLRPVSKAAIARMLDGLEHFGMGYSWGGFESLVIPFYPHALRALDSWPEETAALRFHIGLESTDDLKRDLEAGFARLAG